MGFYNNNRILQHKAELEKIESNRASECIPIHVRIEPTEVCNFRCSFCWWHNDRKRSTLASFNFTGKQSMGRDRLLRLIDELAELGTKACSFTGAGDPLMYPYMAQVLKRVRDNRLAFGVTSNLAMPMSDELISILVKGNWLRWSMNAGTLETYSAVNNPRAADTAAVFSRVKENVRRVNDARKQNGERMDFNASYVITHGNQGDLLQACHLAKELGLDGISFRPDLPIQRQQEHNGYNEDVILDIRKAQNHIQTKTFAIHADIERQQDGVTIKDDKLVCFYANHTAYVDAHGDVYPCCYTRYHSRYVIGNILDRSFSKFWFDSTQRQFYRKLVQKTCPACSYGLINEILKPLYLHEIRAEDAFVESQQKDFFI